MGAISVEQRTQIVALLQLGSGISEIARKCKVSRPTVYSIQAELSSAETAPVRPTLSTGQVADKIRCIAESDTSRASDKLAAWKLYSLMHGLISENEAKSAQVNVNVLGSASVEVLEREYEAIRAKALESPTTHTLAQGDTTLSPSTSDAIVAHPSASEGQSSVPVAGEGGGGAPNGE